MAVLGPVAVHGAAGSFRRPWSLELVAYLAMHPGGARTDEWSSALWPDRPRATATIHSTASAARQGLGRSRAGQFHLPWGRGRLRLAASVQTDWGWLCALARHRQAASWWEALDLVRGRPLEGLRSPDWPVLEGFAAEIQAAVVALAQRLALCELAAGRPVSAGRAVRKGLLASPFDERLYHLVLRVAQQCGGRRGLDAAMEELLVRAGAPGPPISGGLDAENVLHPSTVGLYRTLRSGGHGRPLDPCHRGRPSQAPRGEDGVTRDYVPSLQADSRRGPHRHGKGVSSR